MIKDKWQWLAEVCVPSETGGFHLSTGVPLSPQYLLTTGHGLAQSQQAEVRFIHDFHNHPDQWRKAEVVWDGRSQRLDAVLLELEPVDELIPFIYSENLPSTTVNWEGAGFPAANEITEGALKGCRESKGLTGKYQPGGGLKTQELDLTVEPSPKIPGQWAGISGAPVICKGKLIGVVKSYSADFAGKCLAAVPISLLLQDPDLAERLGYHERKKLLAEKKNEIKELLSRSSQVVEALHKQSALSRIVNSTEAVTEALFELEIGIFINTVYRASLPSFGLDEKDQQILEELMEVMLPLLHAPGIPESLRKNLGSAMLLGLPAATRTFAEIIMAGVDRRPTSFRKPVSSQEFPVSNLEIEPPPESGFSVTEEMTHTAFEDHLINKFASAAKSENLKRNELIEQVNDELEYIATQKHTYGYHYYLICKNSETREDIPQLQQLNSRFPQLTFVALSNTSYASYQRERKHCRPLRDLFAETKGD